MQIRNIITLMILMVITNQAFAWSWGDLKEKLFQIGVSTGSSICFVNTRKDNPDLVPENIVSLTDCTTDTVDNNGKLMFKQTVKTTLYVNGTSETTTRVYPVKQDSETEN